MKQDTGVLFQPDALLNFPTLDGLSCLILSKVKLEIAKPLGMEHPFYELGGIGYDFQEVSDLATHFADEIERLCHTGPIQVGV